MSGQKYGVYSELKSSEGGWLGEIPAHGRASEKYCRVGHFKKGFTSRLVPRMIWQYEPEAAR